jgi:BASS family bile acid:Na+ symporter
MNGFLATLLNLAVLVFAVASMLSVGLGYTVRTIIGPLRNAHAVARALLANFVLVPLFTLVVLKTLPLDQSYETGLFLIATAAGAPFLIKLAQAADIDVALSASLLVLLLIVTMIYMPVIVPLVLPDAEVSAASIAKPLLWTMLLPLAIGHFVEAKFSKWAKRLAPVTGKVSTVALIVLLVTTFLANLQGILNVIGRGAIFAAFLIIGGAFLIGYALGSSVRRTRGVLGLGTAQRNIGAATVVATQGFDDPDILIMVVVASLVGLALLFFIAGMMRKRAAIHGGAHSPRTREA